MRLSDWIVIDRYCATRVIKGTDPNNINNRVAFIEKSARVCVDKENDEWKYGYKGKGGSGDHEKQEQYGFDKRSREWCDKELIKLGYELE